MRWTNRCGRRRPRSRPSRIQPSLSAAAAAERVVKHPRKRGYQHVANLLRSRRAPVAPCGGPRGRSGCARAGAGRSCPGTGRGQSFGHRRPKVPGGTRKKTHPPVEAESIAYVSLHTRRPIPRRDSSARDSAKPLALASNGSLILQPGAPSISAARTIGDYFVTAEGFRNRSQHR